MKGGKKGDYALQSREARQGHQIVGVVKMNETSLRYSLQQLGRGRRAQRSEQNGGLPCREAVSHGH